jgi:hypothetical protein
MSVAGISLPSVKQVVEVRVLPTDEQAAALRGSDARLQRGSVVAVAADACSAAAPQA